MMHFGHDDPKVVAEVLDESVKAIIGNININDISMFVRDSEVGFNRYVNH